jgi:O-antigen/teichoic acid export membrane protein
MVEESLKNQIIKNSFWNLFTTVINRAGALIFTIILARLLMPEYFGLYNLATSIALIAIAIADLGINGAITRFIAEYIGKNNKKKAASIFQYLLKLKLKVALFISILLILLAYPLSVQLFKKPELFYPLIISAFYVFLLSMETLFESLFYGLKKLKYLSIKEILSQSTKILFLIPLIYFISMSWKLGGVLIGMILSVILVLILMFYYTKRLFPFLLEKSFVLEEKKRIIKFLSYLTIGGITAIFFSYIDTLMLGIFIQDASYVGYYRAAFSLIFSIAGVLSFANVLLPIFVQIKKERLENAFARVFKYSALLSIPASFGIIVLGKYIIRLVYGYDYLDAFLPLCFLAPLNS